MEYNKQSLVACCTALSSILNLITHSPEDLPSWTKLLHFASSNLSKPSRGDKRQNLANIIKKRLDDGSSSSDHHSGYIDDTPPRVRKDAASSLAAAVSAKIEDGNMKAAIRIVSSEDKPAPDNADTLTKLLDKHPPSPSGGSIAYPLSGPSVSYKATEEEVRRAIRSFPSGSCGGPDGIRPQHIADLVNCKESGFPLLSSITALVNCLLNGKCHSAVRPILFGGNLIVLEKKAGGIRPIAVGYVWRRIAAKCANYFATARLAPLLSPLQLGVAVPGGC